VTVFSYSVIRTQYEGLCNYVATHIDAVEELFDRKLNSDVELMSATIEMIFSNPEIRAAWLARDKKALLELASSLMPKLRDRYRITHFYFHGPDRVNFLRVYNPEKSGGLVNRYTLLEAERTGKPFSGLELGQSGTFTLRTVHPWKINGQLVGYIELGEEIEHIIEKLQAVLGVELYALIYKKYLNRNSWETGMKLFDRSADWSEMGRFVISSRTMPTVPEGLKNFLKTAPQAEMATATDLELFMEDRIYRVGIMPMTDARGEDVGELAMLFDVTAQKSYARDSIMRVLAISIAVGGGLILLFYRTLGKVEAELARHRNHLEELVEKRTTELTRINEQLRLEFEERKKSESEKQNLRAELLQSQKIESLGRLAGGLAHDFNNILNAMKGFAEFTLMEMDDDDPFRENIENIRKAGIRGEALIQQLLAFSRKQMIKPENLRLNDLVNNMDAIYKRLLKENVKINFIPAHDLWNIKADRSQVEQILMNLVLNANDVMASSGGEITIETKNHIITPKEAKTHSGAEKGQYVQLAVSDTGPGMSEEVRAQIFEPFFTTKASGTGMGLATVYGVVKQNGGFIDVESEPGQGSSFKVYFPRSFDFHEDRNLEEDNAELAAGGGETVLVVEDQNDVRDFVSKVLSQVGYNVLQASDGEDALNITKKYGKSIDLLLTDLVMPKLGGVEIAKQIKNEHPNIKILFMTGYIENPEICNGVVSSEEPFLQKPISPQVLADMVKKALKT